MDIAVVADALGRDGALVTWVELRRRGVSTATLSRAARDGRVVRVRRGVYAAPEARVDPLLAAALAVDGVISHDSAAHLLGLGLASDPGRHVTVPRNAARRSAPGVTLHRSDVPGEDYDEQNGLRITTPLRTVLDCARLLSVRDGLVVADSALRAGLVSQPTLMAAAAATRGTGSARIRSVAALADPKAGSVFESVLRFLFVSNGLYPDTQYVVRDARGRVVAIADFYFPLARLVVEADGFAFHSSRDDLNRDIAKCNAYALLGYRLLRFSWEDVLYRPDYVLRSVRAILATAA